MRYLFGFLCVCALGVMPLIGCSETAGAGGVGGDGGSAGMGGGGDGGIGGSNSAVFPCTEQGIRDAVAEGGGPHTFDCVGPTTVRTDAEIVIDNDVILDGEGSLTIDGDDSHRVLSILEGVTAELAGLAVTRGHAGSPFVGHGGGIRNEGTLTLRDSTVSRNTAGSVAIYNHGEDDALIGPTLTLLNSTVSDNGSDGIFNSFGVLALTNSTVSGHLTVGVESFGGTLTMNNSTTSGGDRGIDVCGGVIAITNSTVSASGQALSLNFSPKSCSGSATIAGSLIDGGCGSFPTGSASRGYNIESPGDTCGFDQTGDQSGVTAEQLNLGPLADNGGPTMTHALLTEPTVSVAIDAIPEEECEVDTDQRGKARPSGLESKCDVGSFEVQVPFACTEQGIRDAIAAGGGPHTFDCLYPWDWIGTEAEIVIDNDVILDGQSLLTLNAGLQHRVFWVPEGVSAELRGLHVMRGLSEEGSGIWNQGTLALVDVTVSENVAQYPGGGIRNEGTLTISKSTVWGNVSLSPGGGLHNDNSGTMEIMNSTVSDNFAGEGADQISNQGQLNVTNSTLSGGAHNVCCAGADLHPEGGSITFSNTVVDGFCDSESAATIQSNGYNIESPANTCGFDDSTDQANVSADDLKLGELANNGGPTETHALGAGSVAIDHIPAVECVDSDGEPLTTDQRGFPRDTMCDVGAFELQP